MLARLVEQGLLLTDPPSEVGHQMRDEALRRSQWWPLAALAHRHARWQAVDSVEDMRRQGLDTAAGLRQRLGPPPPVVQPMQGDYQPLPRSRRPRSMHCWRVAPPAAISTRSARCRCRCWPRCCSAR